jgi:hypothetical protein
MQPSRPHPSSASLGRLLYQTRIPRPDRQRIRAIVIRIVVATGVTIAFIFPYIALGFSLLGPGGVLVVPLVPLPIFWSLRDRRERQIAVRMYGVIMGLLLLLALAFALIVVLPQQPLESQNPTLLSGLTLLLLIVIGFPCLVIIVLSGVILFNYYRQSRQQLALYEHGLVLETLSTHASYTWQEIDWIRRHTRGRHKAVVYEIRPKQGRPFALTTDFQQAHVIGLAALQLFTHARGS